MGLSARTSESLALQPQTSKLRVTSRRQLLRLLQERAATLMGEWPEPVFPSAGVALPRPARLHAGSAGPQGSPGSPRPMSLCRPRRGNSCPEGHGHSRDSKNAGKPRARGEAPRTVADPQSKKKKKVEKEAFQVKLLGSEKTRLREMTRGGRTHGVQGTLASTGWAHRGCTAAAPRPGQQALAHVERRGTG